MSLLGCLGKQKSEEKQRTCEILKAEIQKQRRQQILTLHITLKPAARGNTKNLPKNHSASTNLSMEK